MKVLILLYTLISSSCMILGLRRPLVWSHSRKVGNFVMSKGIMLVPQDYHRNDDKACHIYLERYYKDHSEKEGPELHHLILLAGGPGQSSRVWHHDLTKLSQLVTPNTVIYLVDVRGTGKSSKLFRARDRTWRKGRLYFSDEPRNFSVNLAAQDIGQLGQHLQKMGKVSLLGVSFGGLVAARTVTIFPNLFERLIMDSPSMIEGRFKPENDLTFWQNCLDDRYCAGLIKSVDKIRMVYDNLITGKTKNECTEAMNRLGSLADVLRPLLRGEIRVSKHNKGAQRSKSKTHPAQLVIPITLEAYHCKDPKWFKNRMLVLLHRINKKGERSEGDGDSTIINDFYNTYTCCSEIFDHRTFPRECQQGPMTVTEQCSNWFHYQPLCERLQDHLYAPDRHQLNPIKSSKTIVIVLLGGMDLITPPLQTLNWLKGIQARKKYSFIYPNRGHGLIPGAICLEHLFRALDDLCAIATFKQCIKRETKSNRLDWTFIRDFFV